MINRKELVTRHHPIIRKIETDSPLTVGNGEFAFTADPTGMQTFYDLYKANHMPLCTMAQWGWHTEPVGEGQPNYTLDDVVMTEYDYENRNIYLPTDKKNGNEEVYNWLRHNPHRPNLARIALTINGREIKPKEITDIHQELHLYEGRIESRFKIDEIPCFVTTICDNETNTLGFQVVTLYEDLKVKISFPYGTHDMSGSDWCRPDDHETVVSKYKGNKVKFKRRMDDCTYSVMLKANKRLELNQVDKHDFELSTSSSNWKFVVQFGNEELIETPCFNEMLDSSKAHWKAFWDKIGVVDFSGSKDARAKELERRVILSQYLLAVQSSGSLPPQETGLTCNSWHGKFHLEMHLWHSAWLPLWNQPELLERSVDWYKEILDKAIVNASKNGFKGARWPKQVANDGIDSPSPIAPLLVWQQSHIIYMLELIYKQQQQTKWLKVYWELVKESADFMCDYLSWNSETGFYDLVAPLIPAQEEHDPRVVINPTFEIEYWRFSLQIAIKWAKRLNKPYDGWKKYVNKMAKSPIEDGLYLAHENCPDTFEKFNRDHPSMLGAYGLIPSDRMDKEILEQTVNQVLDCWEFETMWGWDFALMAMTAVRLGKPELAMDILLMETPKNEYVISGNNYQRLRTDLPLYLPGNGSLLLAVALMVGGYDGSGMEQPGIPKNGQWHVEYENIYPFPY